MKKDTEQPALGTADRLRATISGIKLSEGAQEFINNFDANRLDGISSWLDAKTERRSGSSIDGQGFFAEDVKAGTLLAIKSGHVFNEETIKANADAIKGSHQQIGPNEFLAGFSLEEVDRNLVGYNHSCDPNAIIVLLEGVPLAFVVAKKDIEEEGEITVDYSVSMTTDTQRIDYCNCRSSGCRKIIQPGSDWMDEDFQKANANDFPWYIQEMIDKAAPASK